jgi:hypothetical protein
MNVEEEIVRLFKDKEPSKLEVSPKLLFNTKGKLDGAEVEITWNEQRGTPEGEGV